jgi:hypothetical protein
VRYPWQSLPERGEIIGRLRKLFPVRDRDPVDFGVHPHPERLGELRQLVGGGQVDDEYDRLWPPIMVKYSASGFVLAKYSSILVNNDPSFMSLFPISTGILAFIRNFIDLPPRFQFLNGRYFAPGLIKVWRTCLDRKPPKSLVQEFLDPPPQRLLIGRIFPPR